jgi:hypothetical protein
MRRVAPVALADEPAAHREVWVAPVAWVGRVMPRVVLQELPREVALVVLVVQATALELRAQPVVPVARQLSILLWAHRRRVAMVAFAVRRKGVLEQQPSRMVAQLRQSGVAPQLRVSLETMANRCATEADQQRVAPLFITSRSINAVRDHTV